ILACAVARQYPATPETIGNGIGSEAQDVAAAYGSGYIAYLIGEPTFARACAAIGGASRLGQQGTRLLVGPVGRILVSRLRLEQRRRRLSPTGLARLLAEKAITHREGVGGRLARRTPYMGSELPGHPR